MDERVVGVMSDNKVPFSGERLGELRRIAEAATHGEWRSGRVDAQSYSSTGEPFMNVYVNGTTRGVPGYLIPRVIARGVVDEDYPDLDNIENDVRHICTFDPPTALALLDHIDALTVENERLRGEREEPILRIVAEHPDLVPEYKTAGSAGLDLAAKEEVRLWKNVVTMVGSGVRMAIPEGYVGLVYNRSSTATKGRISIANKVGVIDSDYRGEIMLPLVYEGNEEFTIVEKGTRVAQLIIQPYERVMVKVVDKLDDTDRGDGGFGSTGVGG